MISLGIANSRMKDFFDIWFLAESFAFEGVKLSEALRSTLRRRNTEIPTEVPLALTDEFANDPTKQNQWNAFVAKNRLRSEPPPFATLVANLKRFVAPVLQAIREKRSFDSSWKPRGPWLDSAR